MKTTKNYLALIIALILSTVNGIYASNPQGKNTQASVNPVIRYQVNIYVPASEKPLCNLYQVEILNGNGYQVVPAKIFTPGVSVYEFFERGPVNGWRIARLVLAPIGKDGEQGSGRRYQCEIEYYTKPVVLQGPFANGQTYRFDLFPQVQKSK
jgi:hypothetical protein